MTFLVDIYFPVEVEFEFLMFYAEHGHHRKTAHCIPMVENDWK